MTMVVMVPLLHGATVYAVVEWRITGTWVEAAASMTVVMTVWFVGRFKVGNGIDGSELEGSETESSEIEATAETENSETEATDETENSETEVTDETETGATAVVLVWNVVCGLEKLKYPVWLVLGLTGYEVQRVETLTRGV